MRSLPVISRLRLQSVLICCACLVLAACAQWPQRPDTGASQYRADRGNHIIQLARAELGVPYRYGGSSPDGFDCSGLVYYVYHRAGLDVPRTANAQFYASHPVDPSDLEPGDLVFFEIAGDSQMHVGIYVENGTFIHAPESGESVSYAKLGDLYWKTRFAGAGRF